MFRTKPISVGVSLKMYFDRNQTIAYATNLKSLIADHPLIKSEKVRFFLLPSAPLISDVVDIFDGTLLQVGAQNAAANDSGAYTGEISPLVISQIGGKLVSVGHFERRTQFGESDELIAQKVATALRNSLTPIICLGELKEVKLEEAIKEVNSQLDKALSASTGLLRNQVILAYEPGWAIGAAKPASIEHIDEMISALQNHAKKIGLGKFSIIYGGSANPEMVNQLSTDVDGLFLGRFAHDPNAVRTVLDEFNKQYQVSNVG